MAEKPYKPKSVKTRSRAGKVANPLIARVGTYSASFEVFLSKNRTTFPIQELRKICEKQEVLCEQDLPRKKRPRPSIAESFYSNIRCGILHSAQTKAETRLSDREGFTVSVEDGVLVVSVKGISNLVKTHFEEYAVKLLDVKEIDLRNNFIKKMTYVCRK